MYSEAPVFSNAKDIGSIAAINTIPVSYTHLARLKASEAGLEINFIEADIRTLNLQEKYDAALFIEQVELSKDCLLYTSQEKCQELAEQAHELGLEVLLEIHSAEELPYINSKIDMIGKMCIRDSSYSGL